MKNPDLKQMVFKTVSTTPRDGEATRVALKNNLKESNCYKSHIFKVLFLICSWITHVSTVKIYPLVERNKSLCPNDMTTCRMPQSYAEKFWAKSCFRNKCSTGAAVCVHDSNSTQMHYICATSREMTCNAGYHGSFLYVLENNLLLFDKIECPPGTFTLGSHDCRMPCQKYPDIDLTVFTVLENASITGEPAVVECNRANNYCPINMKYGKKFRYTSHVLLDDVCGEIGSTKACLPDEYTENSNSRIRVIEEEISSTQPTSTSSSQKASVQKQDVGILAANSTPTGQTQITAPTSMAQSPVLASVPRTETANTADKHDLTNGQSTLIGVGVIAAIVIGACAFFVCFKTKKNPTQPGPEPVESEKGSRASQSTTTVINTENYYDMRKCKRINIKRSGTSDTLVTNDGKCNGSVPEDEHTVQEKLLPPVDRGN